MTTEMQKTETQVTKPQTWTNEEKKIIQTQFFPENTTLEEMKYCMKVADSLGLNPILKQIWFVPRRSKGENGQWRNKIEPMAGRDSFLTLAHRSGKFAGIKSWCEIKDCPKLINGAWETKKDLYGIAEVRRTDTDEVYLVAVPYFEYVQTTKEGTPTKFWKEKPETMIKKVAESQVLRKAFDISGLYDESEIRQEEEVRPVKAVVTNTKEDDAYEQACIELAKCKTATELETVFENYGKDVLGHKFNVFEQAYLIAVEAVIKTIESQKTDLIDDGSFENATGAK